MTGIDRTAGDRVGAGSSVDGVDGEATLASSDTPSPSQSSSAPPPAVAEVEVRGGGSAAAAPSSQPSSPPKRSHQLLLPERDGDAGLVETDPGRHPTASAAPAGQDGNGANHHDGSMDESSYHFSEDAVSVEGAAQSPMGVTAAAAAGMAGWDREAWRHDDEYVPPAPPVESASNPPRAAGEEDEASPGHRHPGGGVGGNRVSGDDGGGSRSSGSGGRGDANTINGLDNDSGVLRGGGGGGGDGQNPPR